MFNVAQEVAREAARTGAIPKGMQLIQDTFPMEIIGKPTLVKESANNGGKPAMRITGLFQRADEANANFRVYPYQILTEAVGRIQEDIGRRGVMGELDHPADARLHLDRVSHLITKIWMDGKKVYGEAEILDRLPCGTILRGLFESKVRIGISSRGVGDMEVRESHGQETYYVTPGFSFVTWDAVADPSVGGAYLSITESRKRAALANKVSTATKGMFSQGAYDTALLREFRKLLGLK